MTKRCSECGVEKPLEDFYKDPARRDGLKASCKACELERKHAWYAANRERAIATAKGWQERNPERYRLTQEHYNRVRRSEQRADHLRRTFGLTLDEYDALLAVQDGRCAICSQLPAPGRFLHVDHAHDSGVVRGLLCFRCNAGLGQFMDDQERLSDAADYLEGALEPATVRAQLRGWAVARARELVLTSG